VLYDKLIEARSPSQIWRAISNPDLSIDPKHRSDRRTAELVTRPFLDWQQENNRRPFFAFLNYFDAHQAYYSPDDFPRVATGRGGRVAYENAIAWLDANVDTVLTTLDRRGELDNTIVIVTSDHGELFGERKLFGHAHNLYLNTVRVPLLIRFPQRIGPGLRIDRTVSLIDLGATILDLAGVDLDFPGVSLSSVLTDSAALISEVVTEVRRAPNVNPVYPTAKGDLVAVFDDTWQLILNPDGREELFRYREDQRQDSDLSERPEHLGPRTALGERARTLRSGREP
jgi:arylsulfatase A-like enzyme